MARPSALESTQCIGPAYFARDSARALASAQKLLLLDELVAGRTLVRLTVGWGEAFSHGRDVVDTRLLPLIPDVAKTGGVTEVLKIAALCEAHGIEFVPHCALCGPEQVATTMCAQRSAQCPFFERLFVISR